MPKGGPPGKVTRRLEERFKAELRRVAEKRAAALKRLEGREAAAEPGQQREGDRSPRARAHQNTVGTFGK